jgi:hypothetical protein
MRSRLAGAWPASSRTSQSEPPAATMFLGTPRDQCARVSLETLIRSIVLGRAGCLVAASFTGTSAHVLVPAQRDAGLPRELGSRDQPLQRRSSRSFATSS